MQRRPWLGVVLAFACGGGAAGEPTPVLVELFTSEACSSCPPADALLAQLHANQPIEGIDIIVLSQHVDYWNDLGWADPFSSTEATARQRAYVGRLGLRSAYTPQVVVDGEAELVGGDEAGAVGAVRRAATKPKARVALRVIEATRGRPVDTIRFEVVVSGLERTGREGPADVVLAIVEDGLGVDVRAGENVGRTLRHDGVVRELHVVGPVADKADRLSLATPRIALPSRWNRDHTRAVAFVQERRTGRILGVDRCAVPAGRE